MLKYKYTFSVGFILFIFISCTGGKKITAIQKPPAEEKGKSIFVDADEDSFLTGLFKKHSGIMDSVRANKKYWNVQVIYTQINRSQSGFPELKHYYFNQDSPQYFYPASTVKLPVAMLALEKLNDLNISGLNKNTTMVTEAAYSGQTAVYNEPNSIDGKPNIAHYIKKILLVSDNDAYNRLYEFLGQAYINDALHKKGYSAVQLLHRLSIFLSEDENRHTNPVNFYDNNTNMVYSKPLLFNERPFDKRSDKLGKGYYSYGRIMHAPMDFSAKNKITLKDLHQILISLIFPETVHATQRFNLSEADRNFLLKYMSQYPAESVYPAYDRNYQDAFAKFILFGSDKGSLPANIRIFNKVGNAYGQLTDVAYVVDFDKNIEFMVSATIYCNRNGILNDDQYDYESIGYPFMKKLGEVLYDYEIKRKRIIQPDLKSFRMVYDK